jgi:hypothetical protein
MIGQQDDLDGFGGVIQIHIPVRVRVLVGRDRAGEQFHAPHPFAAFGACVGEGPVSGENASRMSFTPIRLSPSPSGGSHGYLDCFHGVKGRHVEFSTHKCAPNGIGNSRMKNFLRE